MKQLAEYEIVKEEQLPEMNGTGYLMKHKKTGAHVLCIETPEDNNKVFNIAFRTPPADSTGLPHIMEHTTLCGSEKYPSKDPFVELVKGSLNTFLNAMTYPDKTMYPIASYNDKDFHNLMSVYMDAVFHPNLHHTDKTFRQEGHHYEMTDPNGDIIINGVVYNEMRGAFSDPSEVADRYNKQLLFPDTPYRYESGGDPMDIPNLTYEQFVAFHDTYYHPSNSYIYLYGDMDMAETLAWMDQEYLSHYDQITVDSEIAEQKPFEKMVEKTMTYGITEEDEEEYYFTYSKVVGGCLDPVEYLAHQVLEYALLNAPGAPVRQALLDAEIGKDVYGGYTTDMRQPYFNISVKGAKKEKQPLFVGIVEGALKDQVEKGIPKKTLQAAINNLEFKLREADYGRFPKGLMYGLQAYETWIYDENAPLIHLHFAPSFAKLKELMNTDYFEKLIQKKYIENQHGLVLTVEPKRGYLAEQDAIIAKRCEDYKNSLTEEKKLQLIQETAELKKFQDTPSTKEELETIPLLDVEDIEPKIQPLINEVRDVDGVKCVYHDIFTAGIAYPELSFDCGNVAQEDLGYLSLFKSVLGLLNTEHYSYKELSDEINLRTGGISFGVGQYSKVDHYDEVSITFGARGKAFYPNVKDFFALTEEILFHTEFNDTKRLKEIICQIQSRMQNSIVNNGHSSATCRVNSYYSLAGYLDELVSGIEFFRFIDNLVKHFDEKKDEIVTGLNRVKTQVLGKNILTVSYTGEESSYAGFATELKNFSAKLPQITVDIQPRHGVLNTKNEGFKTSSQVQYVACGGDFLKAGYAYTGAMRILKVMMSYDYLWNNVRVKNGAYGCMSNFNRDGEMVFVSYRDPKLKETLDIYQGIPEYLDTLDVDSRDMTKYIIGTVSDSDTPLTPSAKGRRSFSAYQTDVTEQLLQTERDQVLHATVEDLRALSSPVKAVLKQGYICVIGNDEIVRENQNLFQNCTSLSNDEG